MEGPLLQPLIIHQSRGALFRITLCKQTIEAAIRNDHLSNSNNKKSQNLQIKNKVTFLVSFKASSREGVGRKIAEIIKDRTLIPLIDILTSAALSTVRLKLTMVRMTQTSQEGTMTWILSQLEERPMYPLKSTVN